MPGETSPGPAWQSQQPTTIPALNKHPQRHDAGKHWFSGCLVWLYLTTGFKYTNSTGIEGAGMLHNCERQGVTQVKAQKPKVHDRTKMASLILLPRYSAGWEPIESCWCRDGMLRKCFTKAHACTPKVPTLGYPARSL